MRYLIKWRFRIFGLLSVDLACGFACKGVLSKIIYYFGGIVEIDKGRGIGRVTYTIHKATSVEVVLVTIGGSLIDLFLRSFSFKVSIDLLLLGSPLFSSIIG